MPRKYRISTKGYQEYCSNDGSIVSLGKIWLCLVTMVRERERVIEDMYEQHTEYEVKSKKVPDEKYCWSGRMMVDTVRLLLDYFGTVDKISLKHVRLLNKSFLYLLAQTIFAKMLGVMDIIGNEIEEITSTVKI